MITINSKRGKLRRVKIVGDEADLLVELSAIIDMLKDKGVKKERIEEAVEIGLADDKMSLIFEKLEKNLNKMFGGSEEKIEFKNYKIYGEQKDEK